MGISHEPSQHVPYFGTRSKRFLTSSRRSDTHLLPLNCYFSSRFAEKVIKRKQKCHVLSVELKVYM
jgi:hypothetical protein